MFEMYHARLMGIAHCIVPQILPLPVDAQSAPLLQQPPIELLASIMQPNQPIPLSPNQLPMIQSPSIVQIIVPAHTFSGHVNMLNHSEEVTVAPNATQPNLDKETIADDLNATQQISTTQQSQVDISTQEPLRSAIPMTSSSFPELELEKEDEIEDIQFNDELDNSSDYHQENEKRQRDRSDFRYVESFEPEKSNIRKLEPDPIDNETDLKNVINDSQIPSVLPVPKALSSPKDSSSSTELDEPPEVIQDQSSVDM
jgi:hypothetical protein